MQCDACGRHRSWHVHGSRDRPVQIGEDVEHFDAVRFRCPNCRATATALPDDVLPGLAHGSDTVAGTLTTYLDGNASCRQLTPAVTGAEPRPAITRRGFGEPPYPSPTPATCFRWVARFAAGARAWWNTAAALLLAHGAYVPPTAPAYLNDLGRSEGKRAALRDAWHALDAWQRLAEHMDLPRSRWPHLMRHCPRPPAALDRTGLLVPLPRPTVPP